MQIPEYIIIQTNMIPSALLVVLWLWIMRAARQSRWQVAIVSLFGTWLHEMSHLCTGIVLFADPVSFSIWPKRSGDDWILGSVVFKRLNLINAAPIAFAPLLLIGIGWVIFNYWMYPSFLMGNYVIWVLSGYFVAGTLFSCLPSATDIKSGYISALLYIAIAIGAWQIL